VFLAVNDEFAGEMQRHLYESHPEWIVGSVISSRPIYRRSRLGALLFVLRRSGVLFLTEMIRIKLVKRVLVATKRALPLQLARDHQVDLLITPDINDERSVATLRRWRPDLIISTNFNHYMDKPVRDSVAKYGCWNLHKSLLPQYRGMMPSFHALLEGATTVGATLHIVAKTFDTGDVLTQVEVPVVKTDSVYSLNQKTAAAGGRLLATFLESYDPRSVKAIPQPDGAWKTYTYPTRSQVRAFRKKGLSFTS
jgi:folate-dependent phosphoribosylglycinamide formyltransferase PurN